MHGDNIFKDQSGRIVQFEPHPGDYKIKGQAISMEFSHLGKHKHCYVVDMNERSTLTEEIDLFISTRKKTILRVSRVFELMD
ncbi:MAG: hypothetical protein IPI28_02360 [Candidatus Omnitrophica bacterium]|nr:hypothetical protein [Candidatus Omnitrophota bacterium]